MELLVKRCFFLMMIVGITLVTVACNHPISKTYTVTFNTQGIGMAPAALTVAEGSKLIATQTPAPTAIPANKRFEGWFKDAVCTQPWNHNGDIVTADITLYAKWNDILTVTFNVQGIGTAPATLTVTKGSKLTAAQIPAPTAIPADKSFVGWFKDPAGTQPWNNDSDTVTADITLYAKWKPKSIGETDLWKSKTDRPDDYYRIPALAETKDGTLLAVTDLRYKHAADVGEYDQWGGFRPFPPRHIHRIDLILKRSLDYGKSWSSPDTNLTNAPEPPEYGCGDAAIVADRDSGEVLIIHVKGNVRYQDGKQNVAMLKSSDGGNSFTPTDITAQIYGMNASWQRMFVTSGKIHQSRFISR